MTKYYTFSYSGLCPNLNSRQSIQIETAEIDSSGKLSPDYKKMGYSCEHSEDCPYLDEYGQCPLFISAPDWSY